MQNQRATKPRNPQQHIQPYSQQQQFLISNKIIPLAFPCVMQVLRVIYVSDVLAMDVIGIVVA